MYSIEQLAAKRQDNFLLLRIIAATMVIYGHSFALTRTNQSDIFTAHGWGIYSGEIAVDMFFLISGFMVSGSYIAKKNLIQYTSARLLRIVPGYLFLLIISTFILGPIFTSLSIRNYFSQNISPYILQNMHFNTTMIWNLPGVFEDHRNTVVNGSIWTLPAEMMMYVLVGVAGALTILYHRIIGSFVIIGMFYLGLSHPTYLPIYEIWFTPAAFFAVGVLTQYYKKHITINHEGMIALVLLSYLSLPNEGFAWIRSLAICYFCFWFAYKTPVLKKLEKYGDPSYGIYLWGWPIQQVCISLFPAIAPFGNYIFSSLAAIVAGYLSWHLIEHPALRLKQRLTFQSSQISNIAS